MEIVVHDTNIFIDLYKLNLLPELFKLPMNMHTTSIIIRELKIKEERDAVLNFQKSNKLYVHKYSFEDYPVIESLRQQLGGNISFGDCSAWLYAKNNGFVLITGDKRLRKKAEAANVTVHGVIYLFDELVNQNIIEPQFAANKLRELISFNNRLPKELIEERIIKWSQTKDESNNIDSGFHWKR